MAAEQPWYAAKSLFLHRDLKGENNRSCYEERIVLLRARSVDEALRKGGREARAYARRSGATDYLGYLAVFHLFAGAVEDGTELYSVMRSIALPEREFVSRFYDDGSFHVRSLEGPRPSRARTRRAARGSRKGRPRP